MTSWYVHPESSSCYFFTSCIAIYFSHFSILFCCIYRVFGVISCISWPLVCCEVIYFSIIFMGFCIFFPSCLAICFSHFSILFCCFNRVFGVTSFISWPHVCSVQHGVHICVGNCVKATVPWDATISWHCSCMCLENASMVIFRLCGAEAMAGMWPLWGDLLHHSPIFLLVCLVLVSVGEHTSVLCLLPFLGWPWRKGGEEGVLLMSTPKDSCACDWDQIQGKKMRGKEINNWE